MATFKEQLTKALLGTPTTNYGAENQAYLDELAKQQAFQDLARQNNLTIDQALTGVMQGLNYGDTGIAKRQQELGIQAPTTNDEIGLARQGKFNSYDTTYNNGLISDIAKGFGENYTQGFSSSNLAPQNKGLATKIGEGLGSLARFYDKPIGRFTTAVGLSTLTGEQNPLNEGIEAYVGRQQNMTADKVYRNQLKQLGMTDDELNNIRGNITKDVFEGLTSGMRLGNQRMTYGQLAQFVPEIAEALAKDPSLENQFVPVNIARDIYGMKRDKVKGEMERIKAETDKTKAETGQVGKPKKSIIEHRGGGSKTGSNNTSTTTTQTDYVQMKAPNGKIFKVPRTRVKEMISKGGKVIG